MSPTVLVISSALAVALLDVLYRIYMKREISAYSLAVYNSFGGGLLLLAISPLVEVGEIPLDSVPLLLLAGLLWAIMIYYDIMAYRDLPTSVNAILNVGSFIFMTFAGVLFFSEQIGRVQALGLTVIILGMLYGVSPKEIRRTEGIWYRTISIVTGTLAMVCDKYLTSTLSAHLVLLAGYFVPGFLLMLYRPSCVGTLLDDLKAHGVIMTIGMILFAVIGFGIIYSLKLGELWYAVAIYQLRVVLVFLLAVLLLKERERMRERGIGSLLTWTGAIILIFG